MNAITNGVVRRVFDVRENRRAIRNAARDAWIPSNSSIVWDQIICENGRHLTKNQNGNKEHCGKSQAFSRNRFLILLIAHTISLLMAIRHGNWKIPG